MAGVWDISSIVLGSVALILTLLWWYNRRKYKLPSGPWGLPFVGYMPFLGKSPFKTFIKLSEKYGKVFSINLGGDSTVILNDFESVKEAFSDNAILDRPPNLFDFHPDGLGFAGYNGKEWIEQRRHTMRTLKDVGLGKIPWESCVEGFIDEADLKGCENWLRTKPENIAHQENVPDVGTLRDQLTLFIRQINVHTLQATVDMSCITY
ncbi:Cytochrome P450 18a1, partial [Araneus ventricosus]